MSGRASLNHVYRTIWNEALGAMVAVAEIATSSGSAGGRSSGAARSARARLVVDDAAPPLRAISLSILVSLLASPALAQTLPSGGVAVHGGAAFNTSQPNRLTVTTTNGAGSNHSAINWNSFSIGSGNTTNFVQPSAASLSINRVVTHTPSQLFGTLSSNGKLVLVNQSGIAVGAGAVVDTAGFTASALAMSDADAVSGRLRFGGGSAGSVAGLKVDGNIIARGGDVVLIAPNVDVAKTALVESQGGSVVLAAGQSVEVTGRGLEGITLHVQAPTDQAINLGTLKGDAVGIFAGTLRHSGMIHAVRADMEGGKVVLRAVGDSYVEGQGQINATSATGKGGNVDVLGNRVAIAGQSLIDVSGQQGGGSIRVGGDFQGKNAAVQNANMTYLGPDATLKADAIDSGNGGRVIVWADQQTQGYGTISARGGARSGDGGFVEVSGKQKLAFAANVNTLAPMGNAGTLLLDPLNIDVSVGGSTPLTNVDQFADLPGFSAVVSPAVLNSALSNVVLQATNDISFNNAVVMTNPGVGLTAQAGGIITVQAPITTAGGNISLHANAPGSGGPGSGGSAVYVNAAINTNGGSVTLRSDSSDVGGNSVVLAANVNAGTGAITLVSPNDRIQQIGGSLTGASLSATADYIIDLNRPGNSISGSVTLSSNTATTSGSALDFTNSVPSFNLIEATSKGNVNITTTGIVSTSGSPITSATGNIAITAPTGMLLNSNITAAGSVSLTSNTSGNITQTGGFINAGGVTTASAAFGSVDLGQISNDFSSVQVFGNGLTVRDTNALNVGALSNGTSGNVLFSAGGVLTMPFGINIATTGDIALISGGSFTQVSTLSGANIALQSNGPMSLSQNITASGTLTLNDIATGGGGINQTAGSITAVGLTTVNASSSGNITLSQPGNNFTTIAAAGGAITLADANFVTLATMTANGPLSVTAPAGIDLANNVTTSGTLNLNSSAGNGLIQQTVAGAISAAGPTTVNAGTNDVLLGRPGNDFNGISAFGGQLTIIDVNALNVTSYSLAPTGNLYFQAGGALTIPAGAITTTGQISLITDSTLTTPGALTGSDIVLVGQTGLTITNNVTATGTLQLASTFSTGSINQTTGTVVTATGPTSIFTNTSIARPINLGEPGNNFSSLAVSGFGPATIRDFNAIVLDNVTASFLTLTTGGAITQSAGSTLQTSAQTTISAGINNVTLNNTGNQMNVLQVLNAGAVDVQNNTSAFTVFSSSAASFKALTDFDLFVSGTGITTSAGAVDLKTTGQITASAPIQAAGPVILEAGTNLFANSLIQSSAPGDAIVLTSTSTSASDVFGSTPSSGMVAPNGRWLLNLNDPANAHVFQGSFVMTPTDFIVHDALVTPVPTSGNGRLFTVPAPNLSAGLSGSVTKVFDGTTSISLVGSSLSGITGYLPGDVGGTPSGGVGTLASPNVGTNIPVTASGISIAGVTNSNCGGCTVYGYQFGSASGNIGNVTPATITISPISLSGIRAYDGTVIVNANIFTLSGLQGSDTLSLLGSGFLADKNVGVNKPVSLGSLALGNGTGLASNYTFSGGNFVATITPASISGVVGITASNKVYDGKTDATLILSTSSLAGVLPGDQVTATGALGVFDDRHVGLSKNINITGLSLAGADAGNYAFTGKAGAATADITQRPASNWTGAGGNSLWSNPANWDALPDRTNVAAVAIAAGAGTVTFDAGVDPTSLQSLVSGQALAMTGSSLSVNSDLNLPGLSQTGGTLKGAGNLNVGNSLSQTGGSLQFGRDVTINQTIGNLVVGDMTARRVQLTAAQGAINQSANQSAGLDASVLVAESARGMALTNVANRIGSADLTNTGSGNIVLNNAIPQQIARIRSADGDVTVINSGGVVTTGLITSPQGKVNITTNSPLRIGGDGITAGGDVTLVATNLTSPGDIILDGPIVSGGAVTMSAGNNFTQNAAIFGADGVTATAQGAFSYGPLAFTSRAPVRYTSNGVRVVPPPDPRAITRSESPQVVIAFLDQFSRAQRRQIVDTLESNPDGTPVKRRDRDAVLTEGNVCAR